MTDNELLFAISDMMDKKLKPLEIKIQHIEVDLLQNNVLSRLNDVEESLQLHEKTETFL